MQNYILSIISAHLPPGVVLPNTKYPLNIDSRKYLIQSMKILSHIITIEKNVKILSIKRLENVFHVEVI